jgi:hypothetical protein
LRIGDCGRASKPAGNGSIRDAGIEYLARNQRLVRFLSRKAVRTALGCDWDHGWEVIEIASDAKTVQMARSGEASGQEQELGTQSCYETAIFS